MLLREKLERERLSNNEKEIASYMLEKGCAVADLTVKEIAAATYTSPATAVRLAHKLGFEGWNELKKEFVQEQNYLDSHFFEVDANYPFTKSDTRIQIAGKLSKLEQEAILDTQELLNDQDLFEATRLLNRRSIIYVFAASNNLPLAQLFAINMSRIKRPVMVCNMQGEVQYFSRMVRPEDTALIISYSGETPIVVAAARYLKEQHVPIVALSNISDSTLSSLADVHLKMATREKLYSKIGGFTTSVSVQYLLDLLYACIFARDYDENLAFKQGNSVRIETGRFSTTDILRENR